MLTYLKCRSEITDRFRLFASVFDDVTPSTSEEILSLTTDLLVDGFVSVTSGQISMSETDLNVRGAQDLMLKRTYVAPVIFLETLGLWVPFFASMPQLAYKRLYKQQNVVQNFFRGNIKF